MEEIKPSVIEQIAALSQKNKTALTGLVVIIAVAIAAYTVNSQYQKTVEAKALEDLYAAERLNTANAAMEKYVNPDKKEPPVNVDVTQVVEKLNKVIQDYPKTSAAIQASLTLSEIYKSKNEIQKSIEILQNIVNSTSDSSVLSSTLRLRLSGFYEQTGKCESAIEALKPVQEVKTNYLRPEALLRTALCYETLNQKDKAKEFYNKLTQEHLDSSQAQQAQKYLKMLETQS